MDRPSIKIPERKLSAQQPVKLKIPLPTYDRHRGELPRIPYPVPGNDSTRITGDEGTLPRFASFDSRPLPASHYGVISPEELIKVWESIVAQVDWSKVVQEVGGTGTPDTYRDVFKMIMHSHIEEPLEQDEERKDMRIQLGKRDDAGTESWNDSSEDGDNFRYSDNHAFLESVESSWGSVDYVDDETDDEEVTDDEEDSDHEQDRDDD